MFQSVTFLGTSSGVPTKFRNVSGSVVAFTTGVQWLFDCGEGTQHQFQKSDVASQGKIEKIFITHLHGDHCYGLPGLMCTLGMLHGKRATTATEADSEDESDGNVIFAPYSDKNDILEIVGPQHLGKYIRTVLMCSEAYLPFRYRVTELLPAAAVPVETPLHACEAPSLFLLPNDFGEYDIPVQGSPVTVVAAPLVHRVMSVGYVLQEPMAPGSLDASLAVKLGVPKGPLMAELKNGRSITLPNGIVVTSSQVVGPPTPGRKYVHLGDTCDSTGIERAAQGADWLVHESTYDDASAHLAIPRGHSTSRMAATFASKIGAKHLLLTHFSARHIPKSKDPQGMACLESQAREVMVGEISLMEDFDTYQLSRKRS